MDLLVNKSTNLKDLKKNDTIQFSRMNSWFSTAFGLLRTPKDCFYCFLVFCFDKFGYNKGLIDLFIHVTPRLFDRVCSVHVSRHAAHLNK